MRQYEPGNENRGTCPHCERRCRVQVRDHIGKRACCWHKSPARDIAFGAEKRCPGTGEVCVEDRSR